MSCKAHHYGVTVSNLEEAKEFYSDILGFDVVDEFSINSEAFNTVVGTVDKKAKIAFLDAGDCLVELVEYELSETNMNEDIGPANIGAAHLGLSVDDVSKWYEELVKDYDFISEPQTLANGTTLVWMHDPDGNAIEFVEE